MSGNIILIGFMGVGKGRTARALAARAGMFCLDTDDLIQTLTKQKIRAIFADRGEDYFRELESRTARWLEDNVTNTIVSTGGGFFMVPNIRHLGRVIYLHASVEEILATIDKHPKGARKIRKRPLLRDPEQARQLYAERLPLYRDVADLEVNVEQKERKDVVEEILRFMGI